MQRCLQLEKLKSKEAICIPAKTPAVLFELQIKIPNESKTCITQKELKRLIINKKTIHLFLMHNLYVILRYVNFYLMFGAEINNFVLMNINYLLNIAMRAVFLPA